MTTPTELAQKFTQFKALPFPENADNDELSDIFADMVELDGHIAGLVSSFLNGKPVNPNLVTINEALQEQLQNFQPADDEERLTLLSYQQYKAHLDELTLLLQKLVGSSL